MTTAQVPTWIHPGHRVIVINSDRPGISRSARVTTIAKVNAKTFRVEGEPHLFPLDRVQDGYAESQRIGGTWGHVRQAYPLDSPAGQAEYAGMRERNATRAVDNAYAAWRKDRSETNRRAVVAALEALAP
jgi:hypothetical protein